MDQGKFQFEGLKWIREMELLGNPQLINQIKMNILLCSSRIKETELLISSEDKKMLVYLELSWLGRKFFKKTIFEDVEDVLVQLLPSFKFRVIDDPKLFNTALEKVKQALTRRQQNAERNIGTKPNDKPVNGPSSEESTVSSSVSGNETSVSPDSKKQSES